MKNIIRNFFVVVFLFLAGTGCSSEKTIATKPVAVTVERTAPPFPDAVWIDNEYRWDGTTYVIVPAHWSKPNGTWVQGHWKTTSKGYVWVSGYWKH